MNQTVVEQRLDEVVLFVLDVRLFHGNRKVRSHDLSEALQVDVPTDEVFTLGVKRVFDKEWINKLTRIKSAMERECANIGPRFEGLGGFAIPEDKADDLAARLQELKLEGDTLKGEILAKFQQICEDYGQAHPKWKDVIAKGAFSETYVRDRIHFGFRCIKVRAARDSGLIADGMQEEVGGLLGSLLSSIAKAARRFIEESLTGREAVTRKALRPLVAAREKLVGFTFLDQRVQPLCTIIDKVIESMPDEGKIDGVHLANLLGMASILVNSKLALEVGAKANDADPDKVFEEFFLAQQLAAPELAQQAQPSAQQQAQPGGALAAPALPSAPVMLIAPREADAPIVPVMGPVGIPGGIAANVDLANLFAA